MTEITLRQSIQRGLIEALDGDPDVFIMGEDVGAYGGAYAITSGFLEKYGPERIKDTPISEASFIGAGIGSAASGLKPIVELMSMSFALVGFDQIVNMAANIRYMSGGQINVPMVIRAPTGAGMQLGATHSQSFETWLCEIPGLKVVAPSNPSDALGLLRASIKDPNPVIFAESAGLYGLKGEVSDEYFEVEIGKAMIRKQGTDVTLVSYGHGMPMIEKAQEELQKKDIDAEVIDLRSLNPLDLETIISSVQKTGRLLLLDTARKTGGVMAEVAASVQSESSDYLDGPIIRVGSEDVPWPYSRKLEQHAMASVPKIIKALEIGYSL
ncbi:MAG: alpha-ketoacid dehydrogenase subunit beta [Dehalococcoidia bacterium]|nr:alpha-ketoacid dehydrogenase subunit beta [Dehalococcoidia bacterium]